MASLSEPPATTPPPTRRHRVQAATLTAGCLALLLFGAYLDSPIEAQAKAALQQRPNSLSSFGYPSCGFQRVTAMPCASCGMTTAFTYFTDGQIALAFAAQPAGALVCLGTAMLALIGAWALLTAMPLGPLFRTIFRARHVLIAVGVVLAAWAFNIIRTLGA